MLTFSEKFALFDMANRMVEKPVTNKSLTNKRYEIVVEIYRKLLPEFEVNASNDSPELKLGKYKS